MARCGCVMVDRAFEIFENPLGIHPSRSCVAATGNVETIVSVEVSFIRVGFVVLEARRTNWP